MNFDISTKSIIYECCESLEYLTKKTQDEIRGEISKKGKGVNFLQDKSDLIYGKDIGLRIYKFGESYSEILFNSFNSELFDNTKRFLFQFLWREAFDRDEKFPFNDSLEEFQNVYFSALFNFNKKLSNPLCISYRLAKTLYDSRNVNSIDDFSYLTRLYHSSLNSNKSIEDILTNLWNNKAI